VGAVNFTAHDGPIAVTTGDYDRDGFVDAVVANNDTNDITLLHGNGRGSFRNPVNFPAGAHPNAVTSADFGGRGAADVVVSSEGGQSIMFLRNNLTGGFVASKAIAVAGRVGKMAPIDINRDGLPDLVMTHPADKLLGYLIADGTDLSNPQTLPLLGVPAGLTVADVNGDSVADVIVAEGGPGAVEVVIGNGDGTFTGFIPAQLPDDVTDVAVADFDEDGIPDVAALSASSRLISILEGAGDGRLSVVLELEAPDQAIGIAAADLNGDGHKDLVVVSNGADVLKVFLGNGFGEFDNGSVFATGRGPVAFTLVDLNPTQNPLPDVVLVNGDGQNVSVLRNTTSSNLQPEPTATLLPGVPTPTRQPTLGPGTPSPPPTPRPSATPRPTKTSSKSTKNSSSGGSGCEMDVAGAGAIPWSLISGALVLLGLRRMTQRPPH
jgi:VCBS repeat protein